MWIKFCDKVIGACSTKTVSMFLNSLITGMEHFCSTCSLNVVRIRKSGYFQMPLSLISVNWDRRGLKTCTQANLYKICTVPRSFIRLPHNETTFLIFSEIIFSKSQDSSMNRVRTAFFLLDICPIELFGQFFFWFWTYHMWDMVTTVKWFFYFKRTIFWWKWGYHFWWK